MEDLQLLGLIRNGDEGAFDALFRRHYASLVGFAEALLRGRGVAEDVVQDVLLELWRRRETIDIGDSCKAYLFRSVRNRALNALRHESTVQRLEPEVRDTINESAAPQADAEVSTGELELAINAAVESLKDPIRECFLMSRRDKLTYNQIADVMGISVKTVEARMGRALKELREALALWLPESA